MMQSVSERLNRIRREARHKHTIFIILSFAECWEESRILKAALQNRRTSDGKAFQVLRNVEDDRCVSNEDLKTFASVCTVCVIFAAKTYGRIKASREREEYLAHILEESIKGRKDIIVVKMCESAMITTSQKKESSIKVSEGDDYTLGDAAVEPESEPGSEKSRAGKFATVEELIDDSLLFKKNQTLSWIKNSNQLIIPEDLLYRIEESAFAIDRTRQVLPSPTHQPPSLHL
jgi:hypothetical protein